MDVVPVEHSLYLCPIPSDQPAKGCLDQVRIMRNLCPLPFSGTEVAGQRPLNSSSAVVVGSDSTAGRMPGRRSSTVGGRSQACSLWLLSENEKEADDRSATLSAP